MINTLDVVSEIIDKNPAVDFLTFYKYPEQTLIQEKVDLSKTDKEFIAAALKTREKLRLPFRDSLMLSFFDKENVSMKLLVNALAHNQNTKKINTCDIEKIRNLLNTFPQKNLSLNSEVHFKDKTAKHLFLLDFHIFPSTNNLKIISDILGLMELHGYILDSGESYHFISDCFFGLDSLINLLAKSLLFSPIVDRSWIAHQLLERSCSLRVGKKHNVYPTVIKKV